MMDGHFAKKEGHGWNLLKIAKQQNLLHSLAETVACESPYVGKWLQTNSEYT